MSYAPSTSFYILTEPDSADLPNAQVLSVSQGLSLTSSGSGGVLTVGVAEGLKSLATLSTTGLLAYNTQNDAISPRTLQSDGTVVITNGDGLNGNPTLGVSPQTTIQLSKGSANAGLSVGNFPEFHFTATGVASCTINPDTTNNRFVVNYNVPTGTGSGTVTEVAAESSNDTLTISGSPIDSSGTLDIIMPATGVVAGSYTSANIVVDAYGRLTYAANGSGGGGGGTVTSVELASPLATLSISGTNPITTGGVIDIDLPITGVAQGSYTNCDLSVDPYGRITSISNGSGGGGGTGTVTSVAAQSTTSTILVSGSPITTSGTLNLNLPTTSVVAGSYNNATLTIDSYGRITAASSGTAGQISSVVGTANQVTATTAGSVVTLSTPSTFIAPGTIQGNSIQFPNSATVKNSSQLSYYNNVSNYNMQIQFWNGSSFADGATIPVNFERVGNTITVIIGPSTGRFPFGTGSPTFNSQVLATTTAIPAQFCPPSIPQGEWVVINTGWLFCSTTGLNIPVTFAIGNNPMGNYVSNFYQLGFITNLSLNSTPGSVSFGAGQTFDYGTAVGSNVSYWACGYPGTYLCW